MEEISRYKNSRGSERDSNLTEFLFDEEKLEVVFEDVPDEDEKVFPLGWEDHLYESWRDQQKDKQTEDENEIS